MAKIGVFFKNFDGSILNNYLLARNKVSHHSSLVIVYFQAHFPCSLLRFVDVKNIIELNLCDINIITLPDYRRQDVPDVSDRAVTYKAYATGHMLFKIFIHCQMYY